MYIVYIVNTRYYRADQCLYALVFLIYEYIYTVLVQAEARPLLICKYDEGYSIQSLYDKYFVFCSLNLLTEFHLKNKYHQCLLNVWPSDH